MPQQNMSSKIGTSSSKLHTSVIKNSANGQAVVPAPGVTKSGQYNKQTVTVKK